MCAFCLHTFSILAVNLLLQSMKIYTEEFLRIQALDRCFRDRTKKYFISDLLIESNKAVRDHYPDKENIQRRTFFDDIKIMEELPGFKESLEKFDDYDNMNKKEFDFLHEKDQARLNKNSKGRKLKGYRYADNSFKLTHSTMDEIEKAQLKKAISIMSRLKGRQGFEGLQEIILKLEKDLLNDEELPLILGYDENEKLVGLEFLDEIINGIKNKEALRICYEPYNKPKRENIIYPHYLKQYNKRWFLFATIKGAPEFDHIPVFSIDRIKKLTPCHPDIEPYIVEDPNIEKYLEGVIGVSTKLKKARHSVFLKFHPRRYDFVKTKPLHNSQIATDHNYNIQISVVLNKELEQLILSYGADVRVIAPPILKNRIKEIIDNMAKNFIQGQKEVTGNGDLVELENEV